MSNLDELELELAKLQNRRRNCSFMEIKMLDQQIKELEDKIEEVKRK